MESKKYYCLPAKKLALMASSTADEATGYSGYWDNHLRRGGYCIAAGQLMVIKDKEGED